MFTTIARTTANKLRNVPKKNSIRAFSRRSNRYDRRERRDLVPKTPPPRHPGGRDDTRGKGGILFKWIGVTGGSVMATLYMYYYLNVGARPMEDRYDEDINNNYGGEGSNGNTGVDPWSSNPEATHGEYDNNSNTSGGTTTTNDNVNNHPFPDDDPWEKKHTSNSGNSGSNSTSGGSKWT